MYIMFGNAVIVQRFLRESTSSNLLEVEGRRKALLVRRAFHGTAVTHAADNQGIIPEENVKNQGFSLKTLISLALMIPQNGSWTLIFLCFGLLAGDTK